MGNSAMHTTLARTARAIRSAVSDAWKTLGALGVRSLLTASDSQPKTGKGLAFNVDTAVLHLAPAGLALRGNVCRWSSPECVAACLNTAGRGGIGAGTIGEIAKGTRTNGIQAARIARTRAMFDAPDAFLTALTAEVQRHVTAARRKGMTPAVRLNGTSDLRWEAIAPELFATFHDVTFYDYTKAPWDVRPDASLPGNYRLTMSYSGHNLAECLTALRNGRNVAAVFATKKGHELPATWNGFPVLDGDEHDARFLDPRGWVVGLRAKGRARGTSSAFITPDVAS